MDKYYILTNTKIGELVLIENDNQQVSGIYLMPHDINGLINKETTLLKKLKTQLTEYFNKERCITRIAYFQ